MMLRATAPDGNNRRMGDVLRDVHEVLVGEVRRELEIVCSSEGAVGRWQVLYWPTKAPPVDVPASIDG